MADSRELILTIQMPISMGPSSMDVSTVHCLTARSMAVRIHRDYQYNVPASVLSCWHGVDIPHASQVFVISAGETLMYGNQYLAPIDVFEQSIRHRLKFLTQRYPLFTVKALGW